MVQKYSMFSAFGKGYLCFLKKIFVFKYSETVSFRFYAKYVWKKCCKKFFECIFWAHTPFKQYQNTSGCSTAYHQWLLTLVIYQQYRMTRLLQTLLMDFWEISFYDSWPNGKVYPQSSQNSSVISLDLMI